MHHNAHVQWAAQQRVNWSPICKILLYSEQVAGALNAGTSADAYSRTGIVRLADVIKVQPNRSDNLSPAAFHLTSSKWLSLLSPAAFKANAPCLEAQRYQRVGNKFGVSSTLLLLETHCVFLLRFMLEPYFIACYLHFPFSNTGKYAVKIKVSAASSQTNA